MIEITEIDHYLFGNKFKIKNEYDFFYVFFTGEKQINVKGDMVDSIGIISKFRTKIVQEYQQKLF